MCMHVHTVQKIELKKNYIHILNHDISILYVTNILRAPCNRLCYE